MRQLLHHQFYLSSSDKTEFSNPPTHTSIFNHQWIFSPRSLPSSLPPSPRLSPRLPSTPMAPWPMAVLAPSRERFVYRDVFYLSRVSSTLDVLCKTRTPNTFSKFVLQITPRLYFMMTSTTFSFSRVTLSPLLDARRNNG